MINVVIFTLLRDLFTDFVRDTGLDTVIIDIKKEV